MKRVHSLLFWLPVVVDGVAVFAGDGSDFSSRKTKGRMFFDRTHLSGRAALRACMQVWAGLLIGFQLGHPLFQFFYPCGKVFQASPDGCFVEDLQNVGN